MIHKYLQKMLNQKGFSLAELLVTVLLMSLVTTVVAGAASAVLRVYRDITLRADAQTLISTASSAMAKDLYTASLVQKNDDGTVSTFVCEGAGGVISYENTEDGKIVRSVSTVQDPSGTEGSGSTESEQTQAAATKTENLVADPTRTQDLSLQLVSLTADQDPDSGSYVFNYTLRVSKESFTEEQSYSVRSMTAGQEQK